VDTLASIQDPKLSEKARRKNLNKALQSIYPEENLDRLIIPLMLALDKIEIKNKEIELNSQIKEDLLLILDRDKVLIPNKTSKTIAWEDRILTFEPDEKYQMPNIIRILIRLGEQVGELDVEYAFKSYLKEIGEASPNKTLTFFHEILDKVKNEKVSAEDLSIISKKLNLQSRIGTIIAVLKGAGIISPALRNPAKLKYEVNPFLLKVLDKKIESF
jgi:hypothetical protein